VLQPDPPPTLVELNRSPLIRFRRRLTMRGVPLSKTSVGEFSACPARWAYRNVERLGTGGAGQEFALGRACHAVVAAAINGDRAAATEDRLATALLSEGVSPEMVASATDWVLWAAELVRLRHGCVAAVEQSVRSRRISGVVLTGRFDVVVSNGGVAPLELIDWSFGRHPKFSRPQQMVSDVGITIYRTLLAVSQPALPERVVISDVHVPGRQVLSVELSRDEVERAWRDIRGIRDDIRSVAERGYVEARPGPHCNWCPYKWNCPHSPALAGAA
jgi:CRISPR/Cas system-associated exonuclease Cas4 (RecB family)